MKNLILFLLLFTVSIAHATQDNCKLTTKTEVSVTSSALKLPANSARKCLFIQNKGSASIYINNAAITSSNEGVLLGASGGYWEPVSPPISPLYMKSSSGTNLVLIWEGQ